MWWCLQCSWWQQAGASEPACLLLFDTMRPFMASCFVARCPRGVLQHTGTHLSWALVGR
jgi:hypothetical protein